ncbi:hypothetical protein D3C80_698680 [compost metagenome]
MRWPLFGTTVFGYDQHALPMGALYLAAGRPRAALKTIPTLKPSYPGFEHEHGQRGRGSGAISEKYNGWIANRW